MIIFSNLFLFFNQGFNLYVLGYHVILAYSHANYNIDLKKLNLKNYRDYNIKFNKLLRIFLINSFI